MLVVAFLGSKASYLPPHLLMVMVGTRASRPPNVFKFIMG